MLIVITPNGYFICDRGRFGFDYVNSAERIRSPKDIDITQELEKFEMRTLLA